jgi:hypothetical protein
MLYGQAGVVGYPTGAAQVVGVVKIEVGFQSLIIPHLLIEFG